MKRLYRSRSNKIISGVCGGLADYFNVDATAIRLIWAIFVLVFGTGLLAYLIAALIIPREEY